MGQALTVTHTASDFNGYNISCFGKVDGAIDITITGGTAPYSTQWTHGPTTPDVANLPAGYYAVVVMDADSTLIRYEVTLTEPMLLEGHLDPFRYPGGYNISCYDCYNGSIDLEVFGGVAPYNYEWYDDATTQDRTALGTGNYGLLLTDANGCVFKSDEIYLAQPERDDWSRSGNAGTDPATQYIGTSDNKDVVFKSNGVERLRLKSNGDIALPSLTGTGLLHRAADGVLHVGDPFLYGVPSDYWTTTGNFLTAAPDQFLGTRDNHPLVVKTNNVERMRLTTTGRLGLGTETPVQQFEVHHPGTNAGMLLNNTAAGDANSAIRFAASNTLRWSLGGDLWSTNNQNFYLVDEVANKTRIMLTAEGRLGLNEEYPLSDLHIHNAQQDAGILLSASSGSSTLWLRNDLFAYAFSLDGAGKGHILQNFNDPDPLMTFHEGKVSIGTVSTPGDYGLYVEHGIMTKRLKVAIPGSGEWSDHVFKPGYRLLPLPEVAEYIGRNGHLPGVPSADCMVEDGLDVAKTDAMLMEKVEELTLHAIDLNKRLERAEQIIKELVQRLSQSKE